MFSFFQSLEPRSSSSDSCSLAYNCLSFGSTYERQAYEHWSVRAAQLQQCRAHSTRTVDSGQYGTAQWTQQYGQNNGTESGCIAPPSLQSYPLFPPPPRPVSMLLVPRATPPSPCFPRTLPPPPLLSSSGLQIIPPPASRFFPGTLLAALSNYSVFTGAWLVLVQSIYSSFHPFPRSHLPDQSLINHFVIQVHAHVSTSSIPEHAALPQSVRYLPRPQIYRSETPPVHPIFLPQITAPPALHRLFSDSDSLPRTTPNLNPAPRDQVRYLRQRRTTASPLPQAVRPTASSSKQLLSSYLTEFNQKWPTSPTNTIRARLRR